MIPPFERGARGDLIVIFDPGLDKDIDTGAGGEYKCRMPVLRISFCGDDRSVKGAFMNNLRSFQT